ncbi:MAG: hypothetical protein AAB486_00225 [Patescibacteria group bacterium]
MFYNPSDKTISHYLLLRYPVILLLAVGLAGLFLFSTIGRGFAAETEVSLSPNQPDGQNGWYRTPINVTLTATDLEAGIASINWRIDNAVWENQSFPTATNLAPNASFENGFGGTLTGWQFSGTNGAIGGQDLSTAKYGAASAKISAVTNGWSAWNNAANYSVVTPLANMTASVWIKTSNVSGLGAGFKVYSLSPTGPTLLGLSSSITGTSGWTFISLQFIVNPANAYGVYLELGLSGTGIVWFDGVNLSTSPTPTQAAFTFSQNGSHNLEYYAINQQGVSESPHNFQSLKIDTVSPYNWRGFETTRAGNEHTLISQITVDDVASGLDTWNTRFQYSVDGGQHWGYYATFVSCSSWSWVENGWFPTINNPSFVQGRQTLTLYTPPVSYCNSNWSVCKIVRFRVQDLAGNESTKDICINGAWSKVLGGDVYSGTGISMGAAGTEDNTDGLIITPSSTVSNFSSSRHWLISSYGQTLVAPDFAGLYSKYSSAATITVLPKVNGYFQTRADFTIGQNTIPAGLSSANFGAVVFVNGDLIINGNYTLAPLGGIIFVVAGDVLVDKNVTELAGYFLTDGLFDTAYNGGGNADPLTIRGGVSAGTITLSRSLRNNTDPAETFLFEPKYYLLLGGAFPANKVVWREITP